MLIHRQPDFRMAHWCDMERDIDMLPASAPAMETAPLGATLTVAEFHEQLIARLPRLRVQAMAMTRNRADADDLVQAAVGNALAARQSFTPGTNFGAWMFRILRNRFLSDIRRRRETVDIDDAPSSLFARSGAQEDSLALRELRKHMGRLPVDQRTALVMVAVQGMSYEEVAEAMSCAVGTAKCRVFRARKQLQAWLVGEEAGERTAPKPAARKPATRDTGHRRSRSAMFSLELDGNEAQPGA
jgi:RNA polymerase sigma-70 factor (ECF subfamily)